MLFFVVGLIMNLEIDCHNFVFKFLRRFLLLNFSEVHLYNSKNRFAISFTKI